MDPTQVETELAEMVPGLDFRATAIAAHRSNIAQTEAALRSKRELEIAELRAEQDRRDQQRQQVATWAEDAFAAQMDGASWRMQVIVDSSSLYPGVRVKAKFVIDRIEIFGSARFEDAADPEAWSFTYTNRQFKGLAGLGSLLDYDLRRHAES